MSRAVWSWSAWGEAGLGQGTVLAARAHREIKETGFLWGLFAQLSPSTNARVPYIVRKTTRISRPSFTPPIILHSLIMSFINFLLKINCPIPFKFHMYATSKHFSEFFSPFTCQLSGAGVRHVVVVLQAVKLL